MIVLASTSPFRRELLGRLGLPFEVFAPGVDESPLPRENPAQMVARLAQAKAAAGATAFPDALVIGSDQCAELDGQILGKPGTAQRAEEQLSLASGRCLDFHTGLCLLDAGSGRSWTEVIPFRVHFRELTPAQIKAYVRRDQPLGSAGSFKSEGLGIALFERLEGDDPTALVGLPLIRLTRMLEAAGQKVLD